MGNNPRIFAGIFPTGISYADRQKEEYGDYKKLAFLSFQTLVLEFRKDCPAEFRSEIQEAAAKIQARRGLLYEISTCGQTVMLGG